MSLGSSKRWAPLVLVEVVVEFDAPSPSSCSFDHLRGSWLVEVEVVVPVIPPSIRPVFLFIALALAGLGMGTERFLCEGSLARALATFSAGVRLDFVLALAITAFGVGIDGARFTMAFGDDLASIRLRMTDCI
jgi:hypothetical protein